MNESLESATILNINNNATPRIYNCLLQYKDGTRNPNGALHISNLSGLAAAGVEIIVLDDPKHPITVPTEDQEQIDAGKQAYQKYLEDLKKQEEAAKNQS